MDYEKHFGLKDNPFKLAPDSNFLYLSQNLKNVLADIRQAVTVGENYIWLNGKKGSGKTFFIRQLSQALKTQVKTATIFNPRLTISEILAAALKEINEGLLNTETSPEEVLLGLFQNTITDTYEELGLSTVLIIDDAELLPLETLWDLDELVQLAIRYKTRLHLIFVSSTNDDPFAPLSLAAIGRLPKTVKKTILPLNLTETIEYINFRLKVAEASNIKFNHLALNIIYESSQGQPKLINKIGSRVLMAAWAEEKHEITVKHVQDALNSLKNTPLADLSTIVADNIGHKWLEKETTKRKKNRLKNYFKLMFFILGAFLISTSIWLWNENKNDHSSEVILVKKNQPLKLINNNKIKIGPEIASVPAQLLNLPKNHYILIINEEGTSGRLWQGTDDKAVLKVELTSLDFNIPGIIITGKSEDDSFKSISYPLEKKISKSEFKNIWQQLADFPSQKWLAILKTPKESAINFKPEALKNTIFEQVKIWNQSQTHKLPDTFVALYKNEIQVFEEKREPRTISKNALLNSLKFENEVSGEIILITSAPLIMVDPSNKDFIWATFNMKYESKLRQELGVKTLIFENDDNNNWQIRAEFWWPDH